MVIPLIILLFATLLWTAGFLFVTDFSVPPREVSRFRRILVIFPHADDEAITCGGSLHSLARGGSNVTLLLLTRGERGTPDASLDVDLKEIRTREARAVTSILGISGFIQADFGDGQLHEKKQQLTTFIEETIERENPDLVITYDLAGLYGHADHIACSEIVTELKRGKFHQVHVWYTTLPRRVLARVKPPAHMLIDPLFQAKRAFPTHKLYIGVSVFAKIKAWYTYKSQRASFRRGIMKFFPLWFFLSMMLFEYFAEAS
jgi:LmbE family N-acetylglucosaminyl deacetylase